MAKKSLPQIYVDEHIKPPVIEAFEECGFKCIRISNTKQYAGRKEEAYIQAFYREGRPFVTNDRKFRKYVVANNPKHAGIVEIPQDLDYEDMVTVSAVWAGCLEGYVEGLGRNSLRRHVFYTSNDGFRIIDPKGKDQLWFAFEALNIDLGTSLND